MRIPTTLIPLVLLASLSLSERVAAQTMYRCGSSYQDQPCSAAQPVGTVVGTAARHSAPAPGEAGALDAAGTTAGPASDSRCRVRGVDAEKIRWAKEAGRTLQQSLDTSPRVDPAFLQDVYGRKGTAAEVRVTVEQDCNAELQRALEAARLNAAAAALTAGSSVSHPAGGTSANGASSSDGNSPTRR